MNFIHYIICPTCGRQIRLDSWYAQPIYCHSVFYWPAGNIVESIPVVHENSSEGMAE